jgi:hypothetical protein
MEVGAEIGLNNLKAFRYGQNLWRLFVITL